MSLYAVRRENGEAIYAQIARVLAQEITTSRSPGDCLPAEGLLAARFGVNRHTLRRAIDELVDSGLLERRHGLGVFVLDSHINYQIGLGTRFTENIAALGMQSENRILRRQTLPATKAIAQKLDVRTGEPVFWIETLRSAAELPICVISHFVPQKRFPELDKRYHGESLHHCLETDYGCRLRRSESLVTAVLPQGDDARILGMPQNRPVLRVKSVNIDQRDSRPVKYAVTRFRADRIQLCINP